MGCLSLGAVTVVFLNCVAVGALVTGEDADFGDAPESYQTSLTNDGPRHVAHTSLYLGWRVDAEPDGQPSEQADGDDRNGAASWPPGDEDGIYFYDNSGRVLPAGNSVPLDVRASTNGYLSVWVDFDRDGAFAGACEQALKDIPLTADMQRVMLPVPLAVSNGPSYARFRFSSMTNLSWHGSAPDGEVEDHAVELRSGVSILTLATIESGCVSIEWSDYGLGYSYRVEQNTNLLSTNWLPCPGTILSNRWLSEYPLDDSPAFFRVVYTP